MDVEVSVDQSNVMSSLTMLTFLKLLFVHLISRKRICMYMHMPLLFWSQTTSLYIFIIFSFVYVYLRHSVASFYTLNL